MSENKTPTQLAYGYLKPEEVLLVYKRMKEEFGLPSLGRVRDYFVRRGLINPVTGQPPTRQGILLSLRKTEEGRKMLAETSHKRYLKRPEWGWPEERDARDAKRKEINVPQV